MSRFDMLWMIVISMWVGVLSDQLVRIHDNERCVCPVTDAGVGVTIGHIVKNKEMDEEAAQAID